MTGRFLKCRTGAFWGPPTFRRKPVVASASRLCVVRENNLYSLVHAPTGLSLHPRLVYATLQVARCSLVLAASLCDWDWSDPEYVMNLPGPASRELWDALATIADMAEAE